MVKQGERDAKKLLRAMEEMIKQKPSARIDYIKAVDTKELKDVKSFSGEIMIALAVFFGQTRLIDNIVMTVK